jgi:hypothetical protein
MRERETHQKTIKHYTKIHHKINEKSMQNPCSKKGYPTHRKSSKVEPKRWWEVRTIWKKNNAEKR